MTDIPVRFEESGRFPVAAPDEGAHVVIIGAGFAGIEAAKRLGRAGVRTTIIDRHNHHLFQPLLYQVATAALSAPDIAEPVRSILRKYPSVEVFLGDVVGIDPTARQVHCAHGAAIAYDILIIATGARTGYFGNEGWEEAAPSLKTIEDALNLRNRVLTAFEKAERSDDPQERSRLMTFAVIGGGPTGVELCGALAELSKHTLARDFRHIRPEAARVLLIEAGPRLLSGFKEDKSDYARQRLERLGVEVMTDRMVKTLKAEVIGFENEEISVGLVIWAAGVEATPVGKMLGCDTDKMGRIMVSPTFEVPDRPGVFALGDVAHVKDEEGNPLPGLAQVAKQQGDHLGRGLARYINEGRPLPAFAYRSRGNTAIIGRNAAIFETARAGITGWFAWFLWAVLHVYLLAGLQNSVLVSIQWLWRYLTYQRGARLILTTEPSPAPGTITPLPEKEQAARSE
jgi:NADH:ubiquinone reductase (H+-translocating)